MKTQEFKTLIKEAVREAIQEELKDILLEAVRAPKTAVVSENIQTPIPSTPTISAEQKRASYQTILDGMRGSGGNINMTTADLNTFQAQPGVDTMGEGSKLPEGNVGLDQIMSMMRR